MEKSSISTSDNYGLSHSKLFTMIKGFRHKWKSTPNSPIKQCEHCKIKMLSIHHNGQWVHQYFTGEGTKKVFRAPLCIPLGEKVLHIQ